ncbi:MAG: MarR family transcriptional regulator, partial [Alphaproteobacteria bacterium]|nr:MarR family transcriptional regulator [Alphaproteobacteria bacterium]
GQAREKGPRKSPKRDRSLHAIAELVQQAGRLLSFEAYASGLNPAQWAALRFIDQANPTACNIGSFAALHRTTHSSASQTIGSLEKRGLVRKSAGADARVRSVELTAAGRRLIKDDPIRTFARILGTLPDDQLYALTLAMETLIREGTPGDRS